MPGGLRTGPFGEGPRTGRRLGYCSGYGWPGYMTPGFGAGRGGRPFGGGGGRAFGGGRGWYWRAYGWGMPPAGPYPGPWGAGPLGYQPDPEDEKTHLENQLAWLKERIKVIEERMEELSSESGSEE